MFELYTLYPTYIVSLVGAFPVKRARLLQWLVFFFFFRQTSSCMYDFLVQTLLGLR